MQAAQTGIRTDLDGEGLRIGIVRARFNTEITTALSENCRAQLKALGVADDDIIEITVPGALEIPVALYGMADRAEFDALVALGCIIRGETYHFELVANESGSGVSQVSLEYGLPIANAILTVENEEQAWARAAEKGRDAASVAVEMALLMNTLTVDVEEPMSPRRGGRT